MTAFVDTNILVRHLTGDPPAMAKRATAFLASQPELYLADLIVAETVYVLESFHTAPRDQVATAMRSLIALRSMITVDPALLLRAIEVYEVDHIWTSPRRTSWHVRRLLAWARSPRSTRPSIASPQCTGWNLDPSRAAWLICSLDNAARFGQSAWVTDRPGAVFVRALGRLTLVLVTAGSTLTACGDRIGPSQSKPTCPSGVVRYVGQGLTLLVPDGADPDTGYTADSGPVHSSGGVVFTLDGSEVQIWRSPDRPSDADTTLVAIKSEGVGSQWFYVRSNLPDLNQCILDSLSYDRALDAADD